MAARNHSKKTNKSSPAPTEPFETRKLPLGLDIHPTVFIVSSFIILAFSAVGFFYASESEATFGAVKNWITHYTGWFFIVTVNLVLLFTTALAFSRFGRIRLGGAQAKPDFSRMTWFAMLFSAGMGIGLLFWSVAEPVSHFIYPPDGLGVDAAGTVKAARTALNLSFYHWGFHAWGIYALVGLALGFFCFNCKLPLTISSAFYPLLGKRIYGPIGHTIDILAVVATLFGVATSLGLGVKQINGGLNYLFDTPQSNDVQFMLIAGITALATISVVTGLDKGIRRLSELNLIAAAALLLCVLFAGPTLFLLNGLVQTTGAYLQDFVKLSTWTGAFQETDWKASWTVFYWAWWIAWSPFVGMFIARVSYGRTVREFLIGVLLAPSLMTFLWLTIFGGSALFGELHGGTGISQAMQEDYNGTVPRALFMLFEHYNMHAVVSLLAIAVIVTFFITSSDSGSLVIDIITSGGNPNPPVMQRIFWAILEGVVAAVLLIGGGLTALQTASITTGLPFAIVLLFLTYSLYKGLASYLDVKKRKLS